MTTYQMTDQDKAVSRHVMREHLFFQLNVLSSLDADDQECATALRAIPNIEQIEVLHRTVGSDGVWAARQVLEANP